jgi:hypothetical protein
LKYGYSALLERDGVEEEIDDYLTDELTDAGVDFINNHYSNSATAARPFFLYMAYVTLLLLPHAI